ncbi:uncharacterized protein ARMOST_19577 [Armillaria ostoyae]|uniref:DUF6534 domain-containing protein n=1 Tax=Armillaria ostoyae TaxID=47428 RepID=A0A284S4W9_ARMOS|nr:uncharacterized protein ARMOST_19577 [Armillaria ostoyae]
MPTVDIPPLGTTLGAVYVGATIAAVHARFLIRLPSDAHSAPVVSMESPSCRLLSTTSDTLMTHGSSDIPYAKVVLFHGIFLIHKQVAILWILDTLHVAISTHALYFYMIESFGNYLPLFGIICRSFPLQLLVNMLIVVGVQALYAIRIWKLGLKFDMVLPWLIFLAVAASFGTGIYVIYDTYEPRLFMMTASYANPVTRYTLSSFFDIPTISFYFADIHLHSLLYTRRRGLLHCRNNVLLLAQGQIYDWILRQEIVYSTIKIIVGLMRLAVISGLATSACSLFTLVAYIAWPNSLIFLAVDFILPKLYINSLLAMQVSLRWCLINDLILSTRLNARNAQVREGAQERPVDGPKFLRFAPHTSRSGPSDSTETSVDIALSEMERGRSHARTEDMTFA